MTIYVINAEGKAVKTLKNVVRYDRHSATVEGVGGLTSVRTCDYAAGEYYSPVPDPKPTLEERLAQEEDKSRKLEAKVKAQTESIAMLEDCIVEMAGVVYA